MLHELFEAIVYVNVTRNIRSRHVDNIERDNCLCDVTRVIRSHHVGNIE
jgi:hypothetical protein